MSNVIEVFNSDGSRQTVSLHAAVRADEVVAAIARRRSVPDAQVAAHALWQIVVWRQVTAEGGVSSHVELRRLAPDERPLKARSEHEARAEEAARAAAEEGKVKGRPAVLTTVSAFGFLDDAGAQLFRERGESIVVKGGPSSSAGASGSGAGAAAGAAAAPGSIAAPGAASSSGAEAGAGAGVKAAGRDAALPSGAESESVAFAPINPYGRGEKSGFLFQRSAANPREWQRRWCILRRDELVHCLSVADAADAKVVRLNQNRVSAIPPKELGGLKHCFEVDTPHDVLQFRAKTDEEATAWIEAVRRNIELASENDRLHLAERMIEDGQRALCSRDEAMLETALGSLTGLLSTVAGADRLYRFAKRSGLGARAERNGELVALLLDLDRAKSAFAAEPGGGEQYLGGSHGLGLGSSVAGSSMAPRGSLRFLQSGAASSASTGSSYQLGQSLRGSAAALSRKEWMVQICERFLTLFEPREGPSAAEPALAAALSAAAALRKELVDESLDFIPTESCDVVVEEARAIVLDSLERGLYRDFVQSDEYERIISTIPSRVRLLSC
jgi:hypothetical protein